jgi:membrane fusion protein, copper/silver efflux system
MRRIVLMTVLAAWACGGKEKASPMPGMTAEEHARMSAGGMQVIVDSGGNAMRQPVQLTPEQERALGVTYTTVSRQPLTRTVRTVGEILAAEPRICDVTPKVEGFIEHLYVDVRGADVRRGERLLTLYSPQLVAGQEELLTARRLADEVAAAGGEAARQADATVEAARRRLAYWDISPTQIARLEATGEVTKTLTLVSPAQGVVLEKDVLEGQRVTPGMRLYRIADLSQVWVEGDVFEQDLKFVRQGAQAHIEVSAYPGQHLMGLVSFVYPTVDTESRTNRVRVTVPNPDGRLKPGMFATMYFDAHVGNEIVVPMEAIIVTGERNLVFVRDSAGALVPRQVVLGARADHYAQVLSGLTEGDRIVASANFLVDAESRLANTGSSMPGMQHGAMEPAATPATTEHHHD